MGLVRETGEKHGVPDPWSNVQRLASKGEARVVWKVNLENQAVADTRRSLEGVNETAPFAQIHDSDWRAGDAHVPSGEWTRYPDVPPSLASHAAALTCAIDGNPWSFYRAIGLNPSRQQCVGV